MGANVKVEVACAIIEKDGLVLAVQRSESMSFPLKWEFPGGKLEPRETAFACLKREIIEELSIHVALDVALPPSGWCYPNFFITLYPFVCTITGGEIRLAEHKAVRWLEADQLSGLDWTEADVPVVRSYCCYLSRLDALKSEAVPQGRDRRQK